ncbi:uncharacterized protein PFL1_05597 [Pseudozyma flocculosa PF-1]|uniref:Enoyl-CoA hydratase n=2 Tax=Pseudozyma flocculosa TaxID=84751 RepID=A0A5C3FAK1_9BASI|nr:uncharacterized protein PFL1_05597 [Pseudozyma flocculosa PF-1]EPQ26962.1 hypothetical protein PFL1_05597 [Pseudozyma flocculosa PF-1]SPO41126.1 uncharacterized protein PSFLO_06608 [Pseudozyma flocculosa]
MAESYSRNFPTDRPLVRLDFDGASSIWTLHFLAADTPDNRLNHNFINNGLLPALSFVEAEWDTMTNSGNAAQGAALITTGQTHDKAKIYSNGLDLEAAIADPNFFDDCLNTLYEKLLTFPIPTIASIGGHAFAAGFGLVCAHDYRVMNSARGYLCMNEIDFGAQLPHGLQMALAAKIAHPQTMRKIVLEGHRFTAKEAHDAGIVDLVADAQRYPGPAGTLKLATELATKIKVKASKDCWGSNKVVLYAPQLAILRTKHEIAMANLYKPPSSQSSAPSPSSKL